MVVEHFGPLPDGFGEEPNKGAVFLDVEVIGSITVGGTITGGAIVGATISSGSIDAATTSINDLDGVTNGSGTTVISGDKITTGTLSADRIAAGSLDGDKITAGTLDADRITANSITAGQIASNAVDTDELNADAVTAAKITAGTITATEIDTGTITADRLIVGSNDNLIANPGFESGESTPHYLGEAPGSSWTVREAAADSNDPRSGAWQVEVRHDTLSSSAYLHLNGQISATGGQIEVHEGDVMYGECYVRGQGTTSTTAQMEIQWRTETGATVSGTAGTSTTATIHATNWVQLTVEGTAPANAVYAVYRLRVNTSAGGASYVAADDFYARRKVGTLVIEDQAVDIARMLDPVYTETIRGSWTGTITTTLTHRAANTFTIPTWVGSVSILAVGTVVVHGDSTQTVTCGMYVNGGATLIVAEDIISGETRTIIRNSESTVTSPGSTVEIKMQVGTGTGNETSASAVTEAIAVGVR